MAVCKVKAANALVVTGPGTFLGAFVTAGADAASVKLWDNTSGSGEVVSGLIKTAAGATAGAIMNSDRRFPIPFNNGLYATITGTSPEVSIYFEPAPQAVVA